MTAVLGAKNPRVVELRRLFGRRSSRSAEVVLESPRTVGEALDSGIAVTTVVIPEAGVDAPEVVSVLDRLDAGVEVLVVRDHVFDKLSPSVSPQPMLATLPRPVIELPPTASVTDVVLVLIGVADPGNTGTLIRSADAVGAKAVVVVGGADPWGSKAVRSSSGSVLRVPVVSAIDAREALGSLSSAGYRVVATDVESGEPHDGGVLAPPVAIVLGSESHGLDRSISPRVDAWANIHMPGRAESLNVAMAGTLLLYEATRA